MVNWL